MGIKENGHRIIIAADFHKIGITDREKMWQCFIALAGVVADCGGVIKINLITIRFLGWTVFNVLATLGCRVMFDPKWNDTDSTLCDYATMLRGFGDAAPEIVTVMGSKVFPETLVKMQGILGEKTNLCPVTVLSNENNDSSRKENHGLTLYCEILRVAGKTSSAGLTHLVVPGGIVQRFNQGEGSYGNGMTIIAPGIRPEGSDEDEHSEIVTPRTALDAGKNILIVVGRPVIKAEDYRKAIEAVLA